MQQSNSRQIEQLLAKYSESHLNPTNELIHFVCVPVIVFSFLGLIWAVHPLAALAATILSLIYYMTLSVPFAFGMLAMSGTMLWILSQLPQHLMWQISLGIFVIAWIGQALAHTVLASCG